MTRQHAPIRKLTPNVRRIIAAISVLIDEARVADQHITQYDIAKSLFLADRASLNKYGRPITFENYVAMKDGPVPSLAYNFLKEDGNSLREWKIAPPWKRKRARELGERCYLFEIDPQKVDRDSLSPSDLAELKSALTVVKSLGFHQVRKLTHEDQAYTEAWDAEGVAKSYPMSLSLLFDIPNDDLAKELAW
jgi:uncharacterized phage-associated protein